MTAAPLAERTLDVIGALWPGAGWVLAITLIVVGVIGVVRALRGPRDPTV